MYCNLPFYHIGFVYLEDRCVKSSPSFYLEIVGFIGFLMSSYYCLLYFSAPSNMFACV